MIKYDKLKNVEVEEKTFDFKCDSCGADGFKKGIFDIKPLGVSWRPDFIDNSDIKNIGIRKYLDSLPTLRKAIEQSMKENLGSKNISVVCKNCNMCVSFEGKLKTSDVRKWMNKHLPNYIDLRIRR